MVQSCEAVVFHGIYIESMDLNTSAWDQSSINDLFDAGLEQMAEGNADRAVALLQRAVELQPGHSEAMHGLVRALVDAGRLDDAQTMTLRLIASEPEDVLAVTRLSMIYQQKGMIAEAEAAAARAKILGWKMELRGGPAAKIDL